MASRRSLATKLGVVAGFEDPHAALEQYPTPPELAAHVIHLADLHDDIDGRTVVDLGAGTGMFALAAALRGPARVIGLEIDRTALSTALRNERRVAASAPVHWIQGDVAHGSLAIPDPVTVVMNPPFGAQQGSRHADRDFLEAASELAAVSYSVHNGGSREFIESFTADNDGEVTHAFAADFAVEAQFDHHEDPVREIDTEVYRIRWDRRSPLERT
ncbi:METTL5 family protein [Halorubrum vacuolatum]|uniref:Methyltransferase n=1 Tax=Halorubrum vacuolatum TaxID=63740 RepID=A0A238VB43_HALVU|nr:METTL5 family protein [Halorubrum vacuolatum]SNR31642.1 methyltransferase [Halorubrum vacuolatum]